MDEQRRQSYITLINQLLHCPNGEEPKLLNHNRELVDVGLLREMAQVVDELEANGRQNAAEFLGHLGTQLKRHLNISKTTFLVEQRQQECMTLIEQLLHCRNGEETKILNDNRELVDAEFLLLMTQVIDGLEANGQQNAVEFLSHLGTQLKENLKISKTTISFQPPESPIPEDSGQFIFDVLETIRKTQGNPQEVYPLLEANLDKLDRNFIPTLQTFAKLALNGVKSSEAEVWGTLIGYFSTLIQQFPLGSPGTNQEIAIAGYEISQEVLTQRSQRSRRAIFLNNLSMIYRERILGNKAENLEKAIAICKKALKVATQKDFPLDWARLQHNLGIAYCDRILGSKAENLEKGINAYKQALTVYLKKDFPKEWAMTQNNLGHAYSKRLAGDRMQNIEKAINASQLALEVYLKKDDPLDWALAQNNLGLAYRNRIKGDNAENIERGIAAYQLALSVRTKKDRPKDWAMTQNNFGNSYLYRIKGDKAENIEIAIAALQRALEVRTKKDCPKDWAKTQTLLGIAYSKRIKGDKAENIERAIALFHQALSVSTKKDCPKDWAMIQYNLGLTYGDRLARNKAEKEEKARTAYQLALEVFAVEKNPIEYMGANCNLGSLYFSRGDWQGAIAFYEKAIAAIEDIRSLPSTDHPSQQALTDTVCAYMNIVQCFVNLKQYDRAIEYVDRSRSQKLLQLMGTKDLFPDAETPPEVEQYLQLQKEIDRLRDRREWN